MENNPADEVEVEATPLRWQTLLPQNSEKINTFVEDVVLPKNKRSIQPASDTGDVVLRDVEAQPIRTVRKSTQIRPKYFPFFMLSISCVQVILMYTVDDETLTLLLGYDPHRRHEIWRFITIMLVHTGLSHLWWNIGLQLLLGVLLEIIYNWKPIAVIYFASVLGSSLFASVFSSKLYAVGASGGWYGLLFSHFSTIILNWNEMDRKKCRLFWLFLYITVDIALNLMVDSNINIQGHIGGAIVGFLVSILVLKNVEKHPWEKKLQTIYLGILIAIGAIIILVNLTVSSLYLPTDWDFNYSRSYNIYVVKLYTDSSDNSFRDKCDIDIDCRIYLEHILYNLNDTIATESYRNVTNQN